MLPIRRIPAAVSIGLGIGLSIIAFAATAHAEQAVWAAIDIPRWDRPVATLDAVHARLVVYAVNDHAGDLWTASLDSLTRWNRHPLAGPAPGDAGGSITSVGDSRDGRLYVAGDASVGEATWTLDVALDAWRRIGNGLDRDGAALAVDHAHRRLIAFGGTQYSPFNNSTAYLHDVLVLAADSNAVWTTLATQGTPPLGRTFAGVAMDETNDRLLVFGGLQQNNVKVDETWALDLTSSPPTWQFLMPGGATPPARVRAAVTLDAEHHRLLMHGGQNAAILHDTWALDLSLAGANWTNLNTTTQPLDLVGPAAVFDSLGGRWFFAGGQAGGPARRDLQVFATRGTPAWSHPIDDPVGPPRGAIAGAVRDGARQRLIAVLEPTSSSTTASEIWAHDFDLLGGWHLLGAIDPGVSANRDRIVVDSLGDRVLFVRGGGPVVVDAMALANSPALTRLITNGVPPSRQTGLGATVDAPRALRTSVQRVVWKAAFSWDMVMAGEIQHTSPLLLDCWLARLCHELVAKLHTA